MDTLFSTRPKELEPTVEVAPLSMKAAVTAELIVTLLRDPLPLFPTPSCLKLSPAQDPGVGVGPENVTLLSGVVFAVSSAPPRTVMPLDPRAFTTTGPFVPSITSVAPPGTVSPPWQISKGLPALVQVVVPAGRVPHTGVAARAVPAR